VDVGRGRLVDQQSAVAAHRHHGHPDHQQPNQQAGRAISPRRPVTHVVVGASVDELLLVVGRLLADVLDVVGEPQAG
jgi:hypothetical protein